MSKLNFFKTSIQGKIATAVGAILLLTTVMLTTTSSVLSKNAMGKTINETFVANAMGSAISIKGTIEKEQNGLLIYQDNYEINNLLKMSVAGQQETEEFKTLQQKITSQMEAYNAKKTEVQRTHIIDINGNAIASSSPSVIGTSFADRDYFKRTVETKKPSTLDAVVSKATGSLVTGATLPLFDENGEILGITTISIEMESFGKIIDKFRNENSNINNFVVDKNGMVIYHDNKELVAQESGIPEIDEISKDLSKNTGVVKYTNNGVNKMASYARVDGVEWVVFSGGEISALMAPITNINNKIMIMSILAIVVGLAIIFMVSKLLTKPIKELTGIVNKVADGDLSVRATEGKSKDEVGQLSEYFNKMLNNLAVLIGNVNGAVDKIDYASNTLSAVTEEVSASNLEIKSSMEEISEGTYAQAKDIESTNQQTKELGERIEALNTKNTEMESNSKDIVRVIKDSNEKVDFLKHSGEEAVNSFRNVQSTVENLINEMKNISNMVLSINGISEQTNLLALNASIEAARAGEAGKGFAVVADEIRSLSEQTGKATQDIQSIISGVENIATKTKESIEVSYEVNNQQSVAFDQMEESINEMSSVLQEMIKITKEINNEIITIDANKEEVNASIEQVSSVAQQVAASSQQVTASSQEQLQAFDVVTTNSQELTVLSEQLKESLRVFKI
ncbi:methyl-accepting chemotaxis protein [Clostridium botulinum]|uniref:Methyl-accepting chemotaxis protein n=1 Tax=Clostridium botulinum TaxID=1491 RepID=A0A6B4JH78_CLOBO|nr:methyl-accepting chemotaxis protein [Clostridium botulinum]EES51040.1 putative methyl-accepting chemotaxis protein [Clostridium botulinum E1 str. 'BoNT E Beluga']MBY6759524.1 methyl-accepting chemotaxis protein [Clostridium botulinum]MBY6918432.1 methyl-accepting chemotaxis protein [Clostridium botulinum]MCR1129515.1 methyl-accepting chemotaxis protein [Clostridium botulinum]NFJ56251.1 methyl-accepting chemotaxis protein [Clostridium botulinum]